MQAQWDALVNGRVQQLQGAINRVLAEKSAVDIQCVVLLDSVNADVVALRATLNSQSARLAARLAQLENTLAVAQGRQFASFSAEQQAVTEHVCATCPLHIQTMLANSTVCPVAAKRRLDSAVDTLPFVSDETRVKLWSQIIADSS